jgi:hypothetical protein
VPAAFDAHSEQAKQCVLAAGGGSFRRKFKPADPVRPVFIERYEFRFKPLGVGRAVLAPPAGLLSVRLGWRFGTLRQGCPESDITPAANFYSFLTDGVKSTLLLGDLSVSVEPSLGVARRCLISTQSLYP